MVKRFDWLLVYLLFSLGDGNNPVGNSILLTKDWSWQVIRVVQPLVTARAVVGIIIMDATGSVRAHVRWILWPEVSEYKKLYKTEFSFADGQTGLCVFLLMMNLP